jgi:hypothetical protein
LNIIKSSINHFSNRIKIKNLEQAKYLAQVQHDINILISGSIENVTYTGSAYKTAKAAISELAKKYEGSADWGNQQARNIIDLRAAFTIGQGIKLIKRDEKATREFEFIEEFIDLNDLDEEMPQEFAKEAEIEGRFLGRLLPNKEKKNINLQYISYTTNGYEIKTDEGDYKKYIEATYTKSGKTDEIKLTPDEFIYKKFAGRTNKVNDIKPKTSMVLMQLENLDKALYDWRKINHLFVAPTPQFKTETEEEAKSLYDRLQAIHWNIGKLLVTKYEYTLKGFEGNSGIDSLEKEIICLVKIISGAVGIPVHFLGLPDLMSNRAVSTDLFELIVGSTSKERHIWIGAYEEIFNKAMRMANTTFKRNFAENTVGVEIPYVTAQKLKEIVDIWFPLWQDGSISWEFFVSKIPEANAEEMKTQLEKKEEESTVKVLDSIKEAEKKAKEKDEEEGEENNE